MVRVEVSGSTDQMLELVTTHLLIACKHLMPDAAVMGFQLVNG